MQVTSSPSTTQNTPTNNPFGPQPTALSAAGGAPPSSAKPSDDLLSLTSNPFAESVQSVMATAYSSPPISNNPFGTPAFQTNGFAASGLKSF